jgi:hypothetical protein
MILDYEVKEPWEREGVYIMKSPQWDTRIFLLIWTYFMIVLLDVEIHPMDYKEHSSNSDIRPRRMTILDDFQSNHYCELK